MGLALGHLADIYEMCVADTNANLLEVFKKARK
jgi:hypothetical protein